MSLEKYLVIVKNSQIIIRKITSYCENNPILFCVCLQIRESMKQLIEKRIGIEAFVEKLDMVSKHEMYTLAAQKPQLRFASADVMMLDYEFTALFKQLEGNLLE